MALSFFGCEGITGTACLYLILHSSIDYPLRVIAAHREMIVL
jgi:hypothetical protein